MIHPDLAANLVVISGLPPGDSGTGRFVLHLQARLAELVGKRTKLISKPDRPALWQVRQWLREKAYHVVARDLIAYAFLLGRFWCSVALVLLRRRQRVILLHPQSVGYRLTLRLLESRQKPSLIYLLDSSFFCVVSYNHVRGEGGSCLRCIDFGFDQIAKNGCEPFPRPDPAAREYVPRLQQLAKAGRVKVAAQNKRQAELAQRHFGLQSRPPVIGLWAQDWDEVILGKGEDGANANPVTYAWDVVFHGHCLDAKGAGWTARLAAECPELRFMFPFPKPNWFEAPANCSFVPCSWESGLRAELTRSRFVAVPSLWSASIEGALVKSIVCANAVIVVDNPTSYSAELPPGLVLKLSPVAQVAAAELRRAVDNEWRPDRDVKSLWLESFKKNKVSFVSELLETALDA